MKLKNADDVEVFNRELNNKIKILNIDKTIYYNAVIIDL